MSRLGIGPRGERVEQWGYLRRGRERAILGVASRSTRRGLVARVASWYLSSFRSKRLCHACTRCRWRGGTWLRPFVGRRLDGILSRPDERKRFGKRSEARNPARGLVRSSQPSSLENRNEQVRSAQQSAYIDTIF